MTIDLRKVGACVAVCAALAGCGSDLPVREHAVECGFAIDYVNQRIGTTIPFKTDVEGSRIYIGSVQVSDNVRNEISRLLIDVDERQYAACTSAIGEPAARSPAWLSARTTLSTVALQMAYTDDVEKYCAAYQELNCLAHELGLKSVAKSSNDKVPCP